MAAIADVLRHLIKYAPALSETNRAEFLEAVDSEYGPDPAAVAAAADNEARIAQLEAELAAAKAVG